MLTSAVTVAPERCVFDDSACRDGRRSTGAGLGWRAYFIQMETRQAICCCCEQAVESPSDSADMQSTDASPVGSHLRHTVIIHLVHQCIDVGNGPVGNINTLPSSSSANTPMRTRIHTHTHTHTHTRAHTHTHTCTHTDAHTHIHIQYIHTYTHTYTYIHTYTL